MRHYILTLAFSAFLLIGCQVEILDPAKSNNSKVFVAYSESLDVSSKTIMDADKKMTWSKSDQIGVFQGNSLADLYQLSDETAGTNKGEFTLIAEADGEGSSLETNVAIYPYMDGISCVSDGNGTYQIENVVIPKRQQYTEDSFSNGSLVMTATTSSLEDNKLKFKNVLGIMKLQMTGTETIKSIRIEGNNDERLSGKAVVTAYSNGEVPSVVLENEAHSYVILDCGESGVQLDENVATIFHITLPPVVFSKGFKVTMTLGDGSMEILEASVSNEIRRSSILTMPPISICRTTHLKLSESDKIIANPERGFYAARSSSYALSASSIEAKRQENITLFHIGYYLPPESDIPEFSENAATTTLTRIKNEMQMLREGGAKCIIRFAYSDSSDKKPWDATPEQVLKHIEQLKPIIQEYSDVIITWQAGFVGIWGEWYYTDNFDYANGKDNYDLRKTIVDAMLETLPSDRSVALRTPLFKKEMYAGEYSNMLTKETAFNGSDLARLSCFNDCFLASSTDQGTFSGDDSREYWKNETKYVFMGGETCAYYIHTDEDLNGNGKWDDIIGEVEYCKCTPAVKTMEDYHWSYLNYDYHQDVIANWINTGCMDEIKRRLGYRLSLTDIYHSSTAIAGNDINVKLTIKNSGFAAPMNGRGVELILVNGSGEKIVYNLSDEVDPRYWFAGGTYTIDTVVEIPDEAFGAYTMYMNLPDPKTTLHDNPRFSIRLANDGIWNEEFGYNKLFELNVHKMPKVDVNINSTSGEDISFGDSFNPWS